jgi:type VI secretion system protein ImpJ
MLAERVIWTEGMLLKPQHFQQQARYVEEEIGGRGKLLHHHGWGFTEFLIDENYLNLGKVVLNKAKGILPDGTLFEIGHGQESLAIDIEPGMTSKLIVLALPIAAEGSSETRDAGTLGLSTRLIASPVEIRDSNAGHVREANIMCGKLDLQLLFMEAADLKGFVVMPIAQVIECKPDKTVILDKDFFPTYLHLSACSVLFGYLREIIGLLSHRGDQLALRISNAGQTGTAEIADFLLLQCINRTEPVFRHFEKTEHLHPEEFYTFLLILVGELSSFVEAGKRPHGLPDYLHTMQHETFAGLMQQARFALSMVLEQHAVELPLQERQYGIKVSPIHDRSLLSTATFVLAVRADMDAEQLRNTLPKQIKIGSVERIRDLVNLHLPGVSIRALPVAPRQIPFHAGKSYFKLDLNSEELAQLELSGGFAFYTSGTFPGLQIQFWAIKE